MTVEQRFWPKVTKTDGCWYWIAGRFGNGYGAISVNGKLCPAHRVSYQLNVGPIPDGMWVLHCCDNPVCVRPDHLFLGTQADNMADKVRKGRSACGSKLTWDDVNHIRSFYVLHPRSSSYLAKQYDVRRQTIWLVVKGKTWQHRT